MAIVTNLQQLLDRQSALHAELTAPLDALKASHPDADFTIFPRILEPGPDAAGCAMCGCATVGIMSLPSRHTVRCCRDIIKCLKLASLVNDDPARVRIYQAIRYIDDLPIHRATHSMLLYIADAQIAAGLMEIDGDDALIVHDLAHTDAQHCPGINCQSKRHPGCSEKADGAVCPDFVAVVK